MKTIIVSVTNDLTTDQRVAKVCNSLINNGYGIILIGRLLKKSKPIYRNYKTKRFKLWFNKGVLFYAEYNIRLFFYLLFTPKEILLANDLDTLLPNFLVSKLQGKKLVFDSHELFSEVPELVNKPKTKQFWLCLEQFLIPKLKNCYTVCNSIANHFKTHYKTDFKVIKNIPVEKNAIKKALPFISDKKIILYQGAVNIGRGLELMLQTMQYLDDFVFVIVGDGDIFSKLKQQVIDENLQEKVMFLGRLSPKELHSITPNASVGISLEEDLGLNYRYALPNKIFDYIQAEVPVLVSNLPEMKQIVLDYKVGEIVLDRSPKAIALQLKNMDKEKYTKPLKKARKELVWKAEETKLITIFKNLA